MDKKPISPPTETLVPVVMRLRDKFCAAACALSTALPLFLLGVAIKNDKIAPIAELLNQLPRLDLNAIGVTVDAKDCLSAVVCYLGLPLLLYAYKCAAIGQAAYAAAGDNPKIWVVGKGPM